VVFETYETKDFDDWSQGVLATLVKDEVGFGIKSSTTFLAFSDVPNAGLLLTFPTGKASLNDLTQGERKELTDFVTSTARAIA
jgi:hypothetical protein